MIAEVIATGWHSSGETKRDIAVTLANVFEIDNPRFDRDRFLVACGVN
jgi:hypothetical protein